MTNIILCGGSGTRLWPISRTSMPKQFVKMFSDRSLFQLTIEVNKEFCDSQFIVSNIEQYFLALDQVEELKIYDNKIYDNKYLLEPIARNTAPAIALACFELDQNELVLVTPSDHLIKDKAEYKNVIKKAKEFAHDNKLVTFGIPPTFAETGFGYIESTNEFDVKTFHEKPDFNTAISYFKAGNYYWNSGIFCFKAGVFLEELKKYSPEIFKFCKVAFKNRQKIINNQIRIKYENMIKIPEDSIDYAVMEKSNIVKVVPSNISWSDLGSFDFLYKELKKDDKGNTINQNYISVNSKNNFIYGNDRKIATIDIEDLIIIDTKDALLISKKGSSQKVKKVVEKLKEQNSQLHNIHLTGYRPWGSYTILEESNGYKIKRIEVKSGKRLSLQKHFHRSEHWIILSGCATVTISGETFILNPNESTYIKAGQIHRLENEGKLPLVIIEVQVGEYTGEDDIVRYSDDYNRE